MKKILIAIAVIAVVALSFCIQPDNKENGSQVNDSSQNVSNYENKTTQNVNITKNKTKNNTIISIPLEKPPFI